MGRELWRKVYRAVRSRSRSGPGLVAAADGKPLPVGGLGRRPHGPHRLRDDVERRFGNLTAPAGGLGPPPAWVRRLRRVRLWVQGKPILHGLRASPAPT